ncbi:hypothetical protein T02_13665 [Trichinella nativa]|uniref:Uncharacterized protein n=1 Tax=Trichinella nativa TaxID=6335 RepID=A0A0V1L7A6_9BILA|nr:hypothetical protein T02_13665 [Trichinella nativa]
MRKWIINKIRNAEPREESRRHLAEIVAAKTVSCRRSSAEYKGADKRDRAVVNLRAGDHVTDVAPFDWRASVAAAAARARNAELEPFKWWEKLVIFLTKFLTLAFDHHYSTDNSNKHCLSTGEIIVGTRCVDKLTFGKIDTQHIMKEKFG